MGGCSRARSVVAPCAPLSFPSTPSFARHLPRQGPAVIAMSTQQCCLRTVRVGSEIIPCPPTHTVHTIREEENRDGEIEDGSKTFIFFSSTGRPASIFVESPETKTCMKAAWPYRQGCARTVTVTAATEIFYFLAVSLLPFPPNTHTTTNHHRPTKTSKSILRALPLLPQIGSRAQCHPNKTKKKQGAT